MKLMDKPMNKRMIDIHSHILPGLDDGAQTMEDSLQMARLAEKDGIEKIVATPHLFRNNFQSRNVEIIEAKYREFNQALNENRINVEIFLGAEIHIAHNLMKEIKKNRDQLVLNGSSYMFVEFPREHVFSGVKNLFFELMSEGITPVIAHPERNSVFIRNPSLLFDLIHMGAFSQANSGSFTGLYGTRSQEASLFFLEHGFVHFIASDSHNLISVPPVLSEAVRRASQIIGPEKALSLVKENPQAVLDDQQLPYIPELKNPEEKKKSLYIKIPNFFKRK